MNELVLNIKDSRKKHFTFNHRFFSMVNHCMEILYTNFDMKTYTKGKTPQCIITLGKSLSLLVGRRGHNKARITAAYEGVQKGRQFSQCRFNRGSQLL